MWNLPTIISVTYIDPITPFSNPLLNPSNLPYKTTLPHPMKSYTKQHRSAQPNAVRPFITVVQIAQNLARKNSHLCA